MSNVVYAALRAQCGRGGKPLTDGAFIRQMHRQTTPALGPAQTLLQGTDLDLILSLLQ